MIDLFLIVGLNVFSEDGCLHKLVVLLTDNHLKVVYLVVQELNLYFLVSRWHHVQTLSVFWGLQGRSCMLHARPIEMVIPMRFVTFLRRRNHLLLYFIHRKYVFLLLTYSRLIPLTIILRSNMIFILTKRYFFLTKSTP